MAEFDIDKGNTFSSYWPQRFDWTRYEESNIADLCLPDGGHLHTEDWTYLFLHQKPTAPGSGGMPGGASATSKRPIKKVDPPRSLAASNGASGSTNPQGSLTTLNAAAVAELGARTRADSLSPALSPRPAASPRKPATSIDHGDSHVDLGESGAAGSASGSIGANATNIAGAAAAAGGGNAVASGPNIDLVYGLAMFHNKADKTVRRGAIQKSLLLILRAPIFDVYLDILRHSIIHIIETGDKTALKTLFETLKAQWGAKDMTVFGKTFPYSPSTSLANVKPDQFGSASLKELVQRFGVDTMYLWYTMLLRQRILFSGQPAHLVGECCLACPLLVAPLQGFARNISPYVALTDISPLERKHYICGTTNSIMETHTHRYDMMASFSTGIVRKSNAKLSAMDKEFILNVISGMSAKGEKWVRDQFFNYTKNFLDSVSSNTYKSAQHKALGEPFRLSDLYENYVTSLKNAGPANNPTQTGESLDSITATLHQASSGKLTLTDAKTKQLLWDLLQRLVDLNTIDELCEKNILAVITPMLDSNSAQVRKYAVATLAQIAISIKGQISLIQHNLIPRVVLMLRDPMPNVASAAAYCLYKISSLFIGVTALVQHRVPKMLLNIICSSEDNLTLKISTAETLLQIHRMDPTLPIVGHDNIKMMIRSTSDVTFRNVLLLLLDLWGEARLPIKTNETIEFHLSSLRAGGLDVRTGSTSMLLSSLAQDRNLLLQIVAAGGIQVIVKNLVQTAREEPLARLSMAILCLACDTSMGRSSLIGYGAIPTVLGEFQATDFALHLYYVCRFFEVACQYPDTTEVFLESHGLEALVVAIEKYAEKPSLQTLTMPCLGALKYLALLNPVLLHKHPELVVTFMPIAELYRRMVKRTYEHLISHPNMVTIRQTQSSQSQSLTPYETVLSGLVSTAPEEREFYQLLHTVVSLWSPSSLENVNSSSKNSAGTQSSSTGVPIIDDELRVASEKLVTLLSTQSRKSRRGTMGSPKSTARGLDAINEVESEESLSRRASHVFDRGDDDDLMAAADSILADLEMSTSSPSLKKKSSSSLNLSLGTINIQNSSVSNAIDAMDDGIDQLLADLASESIRSARSRSTTGTEIDIMEAAISAIKEESEKLTSSGGISSPPFASPLSESFVSLNVQQQSSSKTNSAHENNMKGTRPDSSPRAFANSLGGPLAGASALSQARRPRFVPQLNVGDMWDDIADLTTSILAEVPSEPSTPSTQGSAASIHGPSSEPSRDSPLHRSADSHDAHYINSARSRRRSSLNLTSSGSYDMERDGPGSVNLGGSSPHFGRGPLRPASGAASPVGSPRSGSSPTPESFLLTSSPRKKSSSPRLDVVMESGNVSPKKDRSHTRKTSGGVRSGSPSRLKSDGNNSSIVVEVEHDSTHNSGTTDSPGRKKSRKSIQILPVHDDVAHSGSLEQQLHPEFVPSPRTGSSFEPKKPSKRASSEILPSAELSSEATSKSSSREHRKSKRLSSELEDAISSLNILSPPSNPTSPHAPEHSTSSTSSTDVDPKKLKRKSSTRNARDKEVDKKEPKKDKKDKKEKPK
jgi:hypothetical protein